MRTMAEKAEKTRVEDWLAFTSKSIMFNVAMIYFARGLSSHEFVCMGRAPPAKV